MARAHRNEEPGAFYHVGARGNGGRMLYRDAQDARTFLRGVARAARRYRWLCLAYCLMTNHYHLVLQIPDGGLSSGMQELNGGYARQANARYGRTGHFFRNRFFSKHLETEQHLLEACRYVVLNPVRAQICALPEEWRWSSYGASAGLAFAQPFLATDEVLALFGPRPARARAAYRAFVRSAPNTSSVPKRARPAGDS